MHRATHEPALSAELESLGFDFETVFIPQGRGQLLFVLE